jgi:hypothetical protein
MNKTAISLPLLLLSTNVLAASFPHETVISTTTMKGTMVDVHTETYARYSNNMDDSMSAEWVTQKTPVGVTRKFNLSKNGQVYAYDLDTGRCTVTDTKALTDKIGDPMQLAKDIKTQMNMKKVGACEGAGIQGTKYTSSFGEMCFYKDVFMLWQKTMGTTTRVTRVEFDKPLPSNKTRLPAGVKCVAGPDFSKGIGGLMSGGSSASAFAAPARKKQAAPANMDEAMKKMQKMLKQMGVQ